MTDGEIIHLSTISVWGIALIKKIALAVFLWLFFLSPLSVGNVKGSTNPSPAKSDLFQDVVSVCKDRENIPEEDMHWIYVPESADQLHTDLQLAFLSGQLISNSAVDASDCPAGGLRIDGYANACGLAVTAPLVSVLQNAFDEAILQAWKDSSVPPVLLKQLIRYESQFWPGRWGEYHYGLGHLTYFGAHTTLYWRPNLYRQLCSVSGNCSGEIDYEEIYYFLNLMDAYCPTCENKIDMPKAQRSIAYLAEAVYAHCEQTEQIVANATDMWPSAVVDYATIWKLTLMNYNVGPTCVYDSVVAAYEHSQSQISWWDVGFFTGDSQCSRGIYYANQITEEFYDFPP